MKRTILFTAVVLGLILAAAPSYAQVGKGLSGPHYNLTIIGVPHNKTADMTSGNGHVLFVPLDTSGLVSGNVKIFFVPGTEFNVIDANCTDADGCTIEVPASELSDICYNVYAIGLGTPNGEAIVNAECTDPAIVGGCTAALIQNTFTVDRTNGGSNKPKRQNISNVFRASGCLDLAPISNPPTCELTFQNVWVFNLPGLVNYFWDYTNDGLKNMQIRFYPTTCGTFATPTPTPGI
jgi:hypothetical protein